MKKLKLFVAAFFLSSPFFIQAQCDGERFFAPVFDDVTVFSDVKYGENLDYQGNNTELFFDFYEPSGDSIGNRPLVILAHGGSFVGGERTGADVVPLATDLAKHGYAVASISYRLGIEGIPFVDSVAATEAVVRAVHDMRAAVRFFRQEHQTANFYGINPDEIYAAGVSAGAFMALHLAYLDEESEMPDYIDYDKPGMSQTLEGESGNPGFSSDVKGVVNIAGALRDVEYMKMGDEPLISFHGTEDQTVPYGSETLYLLGFIPIFEVDGSGSIHEHAQNVGVESCLETQYGQDHIPHTTSAAYYDTVVVMTRNFLAGQVCSEELICAYSDLTAVQNLEEFRPFSLYPNPLGSDGVLHFNGEVDQVEVYNTAGVKLIDQRRLSGPEINLSDLPMDVYILRIFVGDRTFIRKIVKVQ